MTAKYSISSLLSITLLGIICTFGTLSCRRAGTIHSLTTVPAAPDYADTSQWYVSFRNAPVDIFYIVSTETGDYTVNGTDCHFADIHNDSIRQFLTGEMVGVDHILSGDFNFYSPYYRQCTLQTFTSDSLIAKRIPLSMGDVKQSFAYYLAHYNQGRPFILAGFSQGAIAVIDLLKGMDSATHSRLVAAYVIGWRVTDDDLAQTRYIRPAKDSTDLGVTICYNSVRDNSCAIPMLSENNRIAINPVNWRTDATPATLISPISTNPTTGSPDTVIVTLDTNSLLLNLSGYSPTDYILPLIGRDGNYHSLEISLYRNSLRQNVALRAKTYLAHRNH